MENYKKEFIEFMIDCKVIQFGDFILKSGRKSSYFINTGLFKTGEMIFKLGRFYAEHISNCISKNKISDDVNIIFGPAYKGIPLAVTTASAYFKLTGNDIAYSFNRKEVKDHGEGDIFVGKKPNDKDKILIVDDVITAGTAIREIVPLLKISSRAKIEGVVIAVDRMESMEDGKKATRKIEEDLGIKVFPIVNIKEVFEVMNRN